MSRDEVVALARQSKMSWREWEKRVIMIGRANGWRPWADRVIPYSALNSLCLPRYKLQRLIGLLNRVGRSKDHPDVVFRKVFPTWKSIPYAVLDRAFADSLRFSSVTGPNGAPDAEVAIFVYVECKTGSGRETSGQTEFLRAANLCPGCVGYTARPELEDELVKLLGGQRPI